LIDSLQLTGVDRDEQPVEPAAEKGRDKNINIVLESSGGQTDEIAPSAGLHRQSDRGQIHPSLKKWSHAMSGWRYAESQRTNINKQLPISSSAMLKECDLQCIGAERRIQKNVAILCDAIYF